MIVAVIAFGMMAGEAAQPFCLACHAWKQRAQYGPLNPTAAVQQALEEGRVAQFGFDASLPDDKVLVTIYSCPHCEDEGDVDVWLEKLTINSKGEAQRTKLTQLTFPAIAAEALAAACTPPVDAPPMPSVEPMTGESATTNDSATSV